MKWWALLCGVGIAIVALEYWRRQLETFNEPDLPQRLRNAYAIPNEAIRKGAA